MAMIRKLKILFTALGMFCALANAQNTGPTPLDQLAAQCQQLIEINDTINARKARLDELNGKLDELKQNWLRTCNEVLSSPACDENESRLQILNELIKLTDDKYEAGLLAQLKEARNNPSIRTFTPDDPSSTPSRHVSPGRRNSSKKDNTTQPEQTVKSDHKTAGSSSDSDKVRNADNDKVENHVTDEQPIGNQSSMNNEPETFPASKDSKKENPERQALPENERDADTKDKTTIEDQKDQSDRNKTMIKLMNKKMNQNK